MCEGPVQQRVNATRLPGEERRMASRSSPGLAFAPIAGARRAQCASPGAQPGRAPLRDPAAIAGEAECSGEAALRAVAARRSRAPCDRRAARQDDQFVASGGFERRCTNRPAQVARGLRDQFDGDPAHIRPVRRPGALRIRGELPVRADRDRHRERAGDLDRLPGARAAQGQRQVRPRRHQAPSVRRGRSRSRHLVPLPRPGTMGRSTLTAPDSVPRPVGGCQPNAAARPTLTAAPPAHQQQPVPAEKL